MPRFYACSKRRCGRSLTYSLDGKKATHCFVHKGPGMKRTDGRGCEVEGCQKCSAYGFSILHMKRCFDHRVKGMISFGGDNCRKNNCNKTAICGDGFSGKWCIIHLNERVEPTSELQNKTICGLILQLREQRIPFHFYHSVKGTRFEMFLPEEMVLFHFLEEEGPLSLIKLMLNPSFNLRVRRSFSCGYRLICINKGVTEYAELLPKLLSSKSKLQLVFAS